MKNILFIILVCFIAISCSHDFMYADETANILGTDMGECVEKNRLVVRLLENGLSVKHTNLKTKRKQRLHITPYTVLIGLGLHKTG